MAKTQMIKNYKEREEWIKGHPDILKDLFPQCKLIMCLMYYKREFEKASSKTRFFNLSYTPLGRYLNLLEQLEFIEGRLIGRNKRYKITKKGNLFVLRWFDYFVNCNKNER